jgi:hypothetical protein
MVSIFENKAISLAKNNFFIFYHFQPIRIISYYTDSYDDKVIPLAKNNVFLFF